jgi:RNA polymerase sigma factor (sigma-70 family)
MDRFNLTDLVPGLLAGDDGVTRRLVEIALPRLSAIARAVGACDEDAEEVSQDVLFDTLSRLSVLDLDRGRATDPLFSYLAKATRNRVYERHRRAEAERQALARAANVDPQSDGSLSREVQGRLLWASPDQMPAGDSDVGVVATLLESLDETDRLIVELRAHTNLTWDDIAEEVQMAAPAVRKRWQRFRERSLSHLAPNEVSHDD